MTVENKYRIQRTTKSCELIKDQQVYAEYQSMTKLWRIHNVKGKPFDIPASKLYHPLAKFFANPTYFWWYVCNFRINRWKKKYNRLMKKFQKQRTPKFKFHMDKFGVFVVAKDSKNREFYFQFRKEDYIKFKEFIAG